MILTKAEARENEFMKLRGISRAERRGHFKMENWGNTKMQGPRSSIKRPKKPWTPEQLENIAHPSFENLKAAMQSNAQRP